MKDIIILDDLWFVFDSRSTDLLFIYLLIYLFYLLHE